MPIKVLRGGETAAHWSSDPYQVSLRHVASRDDKPGYVLLTFKMPSKGGGVTEVRVEASGDSLTMLAEAMISADRDAAIMAFGKALQIPPEVELPF